MADDVAMADGLSVDIDAIDDEDVLKQMVSLVIIITFQGYTHTHTHEKRINIVNICLLSN